MQENTNLEKERKNAMLKLEERDEEISSLHQVHVMGNFKYLNQRYFFRLVCSGQKDLILPINSRHKSMLKENILRT